MADIKPFFCIRPAAETVSQTAALPYDVYGRKEAKKAVEHNPLSFLNIDRPETQFPDDFDMYDQKAYQKARELLENRIKDGTFFADPVKSYYIYELTMAERSQTGIAACCSIDDYVNGVIKKHENTREEKEQDRLRHIDTVNAHTGPVFLAYRAADEISRIVEEEKQKNPVYDFTAEDHVGHRVWKIDDAGSQKAIEEAFAGVSAIYIADGHHRAASAVKAGLKRRKENPHYTGEEGFNYFLAVLFPDDQLKIMPYNRVVKDLNGLSPDEFFKAAEKSFEIERAEASASGGKSSFEPEEKGTFGMFFDGTWYKLTARKWVKDEVRNDLVKNLDVSILQDFLLQPVLGIQDERTDKRIGFVGGSRGLEELERRAKTDMKIAFSMYPTSIQELLAVADAGLLMPPKSTWFEPKLRSGLFIHSLE